MKHYLLTILCLLFIFVDHCPAEEMDIDTLMQQVEEALNGKTAQMNLTMRVKTSRLERTIKMESYSVGKDKSFIKITYPRKDTGVTFLKIDNAMWQYVPRIERVIKIPASMMLQSWMGSDFTNDDLVRESSIADDYHCKLIEKGDEYLVELIPKEDAPVVWGKLLMWISKEHLIPTKVRYFDEENQPVRVLFYNEFKKFGDKMYPSKWVMENETIEKKGNQTIMEITEAVFDQPVADHYFTKRALKQFSQ
ncbi:MAG: outer membrane lipoprotein-sorting protein [Desulfobulbaceae bacterium]|nr:outer membrane lipoprotein-sorting protein [Desulfobulbaceae bacterium]